MSENNENWLTYDCPPTPNMLLSTAEQAHIGWREALGELIDNAFDSHATTVTVDFEPNRIIISDNGEGCPDARAMVQFGNHLRQRGTQLGRYGIGSKEAFAWIGGIASEVLIQTIHGGKIRYINADWRHCIKVGKWEFRGPPPIDAKPGERGTRIIINGLRRKPPHASADWAKLLDDIGYMYSPALKNGDRQILVCGPREKAPAPLRGYRLPELEPGFVHARTQVAGKSVMVHVGIVKEGVENQRRGITVMHGFRVIIPNSGFGCRDASWQRLAGIVDLEDKAWVLSKNKDNITEHKEELADAVYETCRLLFEKAASQAAALRSTMFASALTEMIRGGVEGTKDSKAKRHKGECKGTVEPKNTGKKHRRARELQPGERIAQQMKAGKIRVEFAPSPPGETKMGIVDAASSSVILYLGHPMIGMIESTQNHVAALGLIASLLVNHDASRGQQLLPFLGDVESSERFIVGISKVLTSNFDEFKLPPAKPRPRIEPPQPQA